MIECPQLHLQDQTSMKTMDNKVSVSFPGWQHLWELSYAWSLTTVLDHIVKAQLKGIYWTSLDSDS